MKKNSSKKKNAKFLFILKFVLFYRFGLNNEKINLRFEGNYLFET